MSDDNDTLPGEIIDGNLLDQLSHNLAENSATIKADKTPAKLKPTKPRPRKLKNRLNVKITPAVKKKILECLAIGANLEDCAKAAGVSSRHIRRLRAKEPQFYREMAKAKSKSKMILLEKLYAQVKSGDGDLALKALSRRFPEWSTKKNVKHSGEVKHKHRHKGTVNVIQDVIAEFRKQTPETFEEAARSRIEDRNASDPSGELQ